MTELNNRNQQGRAAQTKHTVSISIDQVSTARSSAASDNRGSSESILFSKRSLELSSQSMRRRERERERQGEIGR